MFYAHLHVFACKKCTWIILLSHQVKKVSAGTSRSPKISLRLCECCMHCLRQLCRSLQCMGDTGTCDLWPLPRVPMMSHSPMASRVTGLRHPSLVASVSHKSHSSVTPSPVRASSGLSHEITLEGYPSIHTSWWVLGTRSICVCLWALSYCVTVSYCDTVSSF